MSMTETHFDTPLGEMICIADARAVRLIDFIDRRDIDLAVKRVLAPSPVYSRERVGVRASGAKTLTPTATRNYAEESPVGRDPGDAGVAPAHACRAQLLEYFAGTRRLFDFPLAPPGTAFQLQCWRALQQIPFGETITYTQQTLTFAPVNSLRAVAQANAHNFCAIVIPCHRVIGAAGDLRGYGGGIVRKRWLIDHENALLARERDLPSTLFATR